jgi:hypothetical protein
MWPLRSSLLIFPVRLHSKAFVGGAGFGLQGWELEAGCEGCAGLLPLLKRRLTAACCGDSFSRSSSELETMWMSSGVGGLQAESCPDVCSPCRVGGAVVRLLISRRLCLSDPTHANKLGLTPFSLVGVQHQTG